MASFFDDDAINGLTLDNLYDDDNSDMFRAFEANHDAVFPGSFCDREHFPAAHDSLSGSGIYTGENAAADLTNMAAVAQLPTPDAAPIALVDPAAVQAESAFAGGSIFVASARLASLEMRRSVHLSLAATEAPILTIDALVGSWAAQTRCVIAAVERLPTAEEKAAGAREFISAAFEFFNSHVSPLHALYGLSELPPATPAPATELYEEEIFEEGHAFPALVDAAAAREPAATDSAPATPSRKRNIEEANAPVAADVMWPEYVCTLFAPATECILAESRLAKLFSAEYVVPVEHPAVECEVPASPSPFTLTAIAAGVQDLADAFSDCTNSPAPMHVDSSDDDFAVDEELSDDDVPLYLRAGAKRQCLAATSVSSSVEVLAVIISPPAPMAVPEPAAEPELVAAEPEPASVPKSVAEVEEGEIYGSEPEPAASQPDVPLTPVRATRPVIDLDLQHAPIDPSGAALIGRSPTSAFRPTPSRRILSVLTLPVTMSATAQHYDAERVSRALRLCINTPAGLTNTPASLRMLAGMTSTKIAQITINLDASDSSALSWPVICDFVEAVLNRCPRLAVVLRCPRLPRCPSGRRLRGVANLSLVRLPGSSSYGSITELIDTRSVQHLQLDGHISPSALSAHDFSLPGLSFRSRKISRHDAPTRCSQHPLLSLLTVTIKTSVPEGYTANQVRAEYPAAMHTFMTFDPAVRNEVLLITPDCINQEFARDVAEHVATLAPAGHAAVRLLSPNTASTVARAICVRLGPADTEERWASRLQRLEMPNPSNKGTYSRLTVHRPTQKNAPSQIATAIDAAFP